MSDSVEPDLTAALPRHDSLWSPQSVIALVGMLIFAGVVAAVFVLGSSELVSQTVGGVLAIAGMITSFYFGSSKGSQAKDATIAAQSRAPP